MLCYTVVCYALLHYRMLYYIMVYYYMLCYAMLYCSVLCYTIPNYTTRHDLTTLSVLTGAAEFYILARCSFVFFCFLRRPLETTDFLSLHIVFAHLPVQPSQKWQQYVSLSVLQPSSAETSHYPVSRIVLRQKNQLSSRETIGSSRQSSRL